jgi:EAL domain-containing protein (putative c-di-GMP-specific phosphodiesterase class I)
LIGYVRSALDASGLEASRLTLEITESTLVGDARQIVQLLAALKALRDQECDQGQGFLLAEPLEPQAFEQFLAEQRGEAVAS